MYDQGALTWNLPETLEPHAGLSAVGIDLRSAQEAAAATASCPLSLAAAAADARCHLLLLDSFDSDGCPKGPKTLSASASIPHDRVNQACRCCCSLHPNDEGPQPCIYMLPSMLILPCAPLSVGTIPGYSGCSIWDLVSPTIGLPAATGWGSTRWPAGPGLPLLMSVCRAEGTDVAASQTGIIKQGPACCWCHCCPS